MSKLIGVPDKWWQDLPAESQVWDYVARVFEEAKDTAVTTLSNPRLTPDERSFSCGCLYAIVDAVELVENTKKQIKIAKSNITS